MSSSGSRALPVQPGGTKQWMSVQRPLVPAVKNPGGLRKQKNAQGNSFLQTLDGDLILSFQREGEGEGAAKELEEVERIEVKGYGVRTLDEEAILSCVRLRICNLSECYIADITPFYASVNMLKLDLSDNQVSQLPPAGFWQSLLSLRVLYLNGNVISDKENLVKLNGCPKLHILTLYNTPLSLVKNYRHHVVNSVFSLKALDQYVISDQEIIENLRVTDTFRAFTSHFKLPLHVILKPGSSVCEEERVVFRLLLAVDRVLAKHSPVAILQRWIRGCMVRRNAINHQNYRIRELVVRQQMKRRKQPTPPPQQSHASHGPLLVVTSASSESTLTKQQKQLQPFGQHLLLAPVQRESLPPPPPCSPRSPAHMPSGTTGTILETHVLGLDSATHRLKYSMHVNLRRLQQNIEHSERESEDLSLPRAGLNKTHAARTVQPRATSKKKESVLVVRTQEANTRTDRTEDGKSLTEEGIAASKAQEDLSASPQPQDTLQALAIRESKEEQNIRVCGLTVAVLPHEAIPPLSTTKRANGDSIRQAKKEISKRMLKLRAPPPPKNTTLASKQDTMSKDDFVFTRVYGTMNLSVLRQVESVHHARRLSQEREERASVVARVRRERITKRNKIMAYQNQLKEKVQEWRCREEGRLERAREAVEKQRETTLMQQYRKQEEAHVCWQKQQQEREFSHNFKQNNTLISNTLALEDRRAVQESTSASIRERVRQVRRDSLEKQEEARKYLELRRSRLLREGRESKDELDAKMLELASQQLIESKKRIAKAMARSEAARAAVALLREEMRTYPQGPGEGVPASNQGPVVHMEGDPLSAAATRGFGVSAEYKSPSHVTKMMSECHDTWQRGVKAIELNKQLPMATYGGMEHNVGEAVSPLMHGMMIPHLPPKSAPCPPDTPFTEFNSSTSSLHPNQNRIQITMK